MTIREQFELVTTFFERENIEYALIGAYALHAYGYTRATKDVDFIVAAKHQSQIVAYLGSLGFDAIHRTDGFSNHVHPIDATRIDMVYVDDTTARFIFADSSRRLVLDGLTFPVVGPVHLITLKLFAMQNDPDRRFKELADIKEIIKRTNPDRQVIRELFKKYGQEAYIGDIIEDK